MFLKVVQLGLVMPDCLLELELVSQMKVTGLAQVTLKTSVFVHLSLDGLLNFLLSVNEVQVSLFELGENLEHLVGLIEEEVLLPQLVRKVN